MTSEATQGVQRLVLLHGREQAREMLPAERRHLVDIAAEVLADEAQHIGITYTGFCLTALPHKRLPDDQPWEKRGHKVTLLVEPGRLKRAGKTVLWGVPYGARARMILLYLQTQAIRSKSPEVALGRSMRDWMERMGIAVGGETARALREQAARISACSLKFFWEDARGREGFEKGAIVSGGLNLWAEGAAGQATLWDDVVTLDATFFKQLQEHPVPLREAALRQLRDRSMSLDLYVWLAWRLHSLQRPVDISWTSVHAQFGAGYRAVRQFRPRFAEALAAAAAAYPEARIDVTEAGVTLHPAPPPVRRLQGVT